MSKVFVSPAGNPQEYADNVTLSDLPEGYITLEAWQAQCQAKAQADHAAWIADPATEPERFMTLRMARDSKLSQTDYLLAADYPITDASREAVQSYRQALRDLPSQAGAPWDGGGNLTPWPVMPEINKMENNI